MVGLEIWLGQRFGWAVDGFWLGWARDWVALEICLGWRFGWIGIAGDLVRLGWRLNMLFVLHLVGC